MTKKLLGHVGVDTGQLMITDPCYIDSEWQKKEFKDIRAYRHKTTGRCFIYAGFTTLPDNLPELLKQSEAFANYESMTTTGKTMNQLIENEEVEAIEIPEKTKLVGDYSYAGACETTMQDKYQLNFRQGHAGAGIVIRSGYGDGYYPVYGYFNEEDRCVKIEVDCQ